MMRREEEIDLVRKAKEGDTVAFAVMIRRYQNLVYATALQILKDKALAEDVAQEAFVTAFRSLQDLRTESGREGGNADGEKDGLRLRMRTARNSGKEDQGGKPEAAEEAREVRGPPPRDR